jgi:hypothetical protein
MRLSLPPDPTAQVVSAEECRCQGQATPHRPHASTLRAELDAAAAKLARVEALADEWLTATVWDDEPDHAARTFGAALRHTLSGDQ